MSARARISASEDTDADTDQRSKRFHETLSCRFPEKCPAFWTSLDGTVKLCISEKRLQLHWEPLYRCTKISKTLRIMQPCNLTGITEQQIFSMAVAVRIGKGRKILINEYKDFCHQNWCEFKAWNLNLVEEPHKRIIASIILRSITCCKIIVIDLNQCKAEVHKNYSNDWTAVLNVLDKRVKKLWNRAPARNKEDRVGLDKTASSRFGRKSSKRRRSDL